MNPYILSPLAEQDLWDIWSYIAADSIKAADDVVIKIRDELGKLTSHPNLGHHRDYFPSPEMRGWFVYSYLIVYRLSGMQIQVVRIIHGSRDIPNILGLND